MDQAEAALLANPNVEIYQRCGELVRVVRFGIPNVPADTVVFVTPKTASTL